MHRACLTTLLVFAACVPGGGRQDAGVDGGTDGGVVDESIAAPTGFSATARVEAVNLEWSADPDAITGFEVWMGPSPDALVVIATPGRHATSYWVSSLEPGTDYFFAVAALVGERRSPLAGPLSARPLQQPVGTFEVVETEPAADAVEVPLTSALRIEFSEDTDWSEREIQVTPAMDFSISGTSRNLVYTPVREWEPSTRYTVTVEATSTRGNIISPPYEFSFTTEAAPVVIAPSDFTAAAGDEQVLLSWTPVPGMERYTLYRSTTSGEVGTAIAHPFPSDSSFRDEQVTNGTQYFYRIASTIRGWESPRAGPVAATPLPPPLAVTETTPQSDATGVARDIRLVIEFDQGVDVSSFTWTVTPDHPFERRSTFSSREVELRPVGLLARETTFTFTFEATSNRGQPLASPGALSFTTGVIPMPLEEQTPTVVSSSPVEGAPTVLETANLRVSFSKPMDRASTEAALQVTPAVGCVFSWGAGDRELICNPDGFLATDADYTLEIGTGARSADTGALPLAEPFSLNFHTAGPPVLLSIDPPSGARGIRPGRILHLVFSKPVTCGSVPSAFHFVSPSYETEPAPGCSFTTDEYYLRASETLPYDTDISWSLDTTVVDEAGNALAAPASGTFHTARIATQVLHGVADADGHVESDGTLDLDSTRITAGVRADGTGVRGLVTFDLGELPQDTVGISDAILRLEQTWADPEVFDGAPVDADSVPFGAPPDASSYSQGIDLRIQCLLLLCLPYPVSADISDDPALGERTANVTYKVNNDFNQRVSRDHLSQFRIQVHPTRADGGTLADGEEHLIEFASGEATEGAPELEIIYEYP